MDHQPPSESGNSPADASIVQRRHYAEYTRSVLGIPALLEATSGSAQISDNGAQHRNETNTTGKLSDDTGVAQTHRLSDSNPSNLNHEAKQPKETQTETQFAMAVGGAARQDNHDTSPMSPPAEPPVVSSLTNTPATQPLPSISTVPTEQNPVKEDPAHSDSANVSIANIPTSEQQPEDIDGGHEQDQEYPENDRKSEGDERHPNPTSLSELLLQHDDRRELVLSSPLTHPNGVSMFPNLSTPEQEQLAHEALTQAEDSIVADNSQDIGYESDAGYDSDGFSSGSTSAESSVRDYMFENGRRYHRFREGHYNFPNEDVEQEREDMKHAMVKLLCSQKLHFAPIGDNPQEVLDIGTGTGIWAIEMGDQLPSAHILGIDLSPIQPDWLPPNVRFMVDDVESPWLYPRNHFDYIHSRHTVMAIKDWDRLYRRAFEHLKRGAWMEMQEIHHRPRSASIEGIVPPDHPVAKFWTLVTEGLAALGVDLDISSGGVLASKMQEAGFRNVTERVFHVPIGTWPKNKVLKTVGLYWRTILLDGLQAIAMGPLTRGLRWNREQVEMLLMEVRQAYHDNNALMYMPLHVIYAQKPTTAY
ncbi:hypothetical protein EsDP_00001902 [Epichloe bromicola]|uniref:Methyltransferase n=1 Tax=Epichloe bromicola TaxID=79588 RepID=A0ABQ0CJ69_9HYPO